MEKPLSFNLSDAPLNIKMDDDVQDFRYMHLALSRITEPGKFSPLVHIGDVCVKFDNKQICN